MPLQSRGVGGVTSVWTMLCTVRMRSITSPPHPCLTFCTAATGNPPTSSPLFSDRWVSFFFPRLHEAKIIWIAICIAIQKMYLFTRDIHCTIQQSTSHCCSLLHCNPPNIWIKIAIQIELLHWTKFPDPKKAIWIILLHVIFGIFNESVSIRNELIHYDLNFVGILFFC